MPGEALRSRRCTNPNLKMKNVVQCIGSLFVPLLLAIFTVIITFQQRDDASQQRLQDLNISRAQRDQDKQIAEEKRLADDINSEKQRNMSRDQRQHELEVEQQRYEQERDKYLDNLLLSYYNEIGELLKEANGTLSSHPILSALTRAKTLNVIEQVGARKAVNLIKFLYDANQLSLGMQSLDLTNARLNNLDLSSLPTLRGAYFIGADLTNASFAGKDLSHTYFLNVRMRHASFDFANISFASFRNVDLTQSTFKKAYGMNMYFEFCTIEGVDFTEAQFYNRGQDGPVANFIDSTLSQSTFRRANFSAMQLCAFVI